MDGEMKQRIESTVISILSGADMADMTEFAVRSAASERLGIDLSLPDRKRFVRGVVEAFIDSQVDHRRKSDADADADTKIEDADADAKIEDADAKIEDTEADAKIEDAEAEEEEVEEEAEDSRKRGREEFDDEGNLIICHLNDRRRVTLQEFKGKTLISIREYYEKGGKQLPSSKGISLTTEQWKELSRNVRGVEDAIEKLGGSI